MVEVWILVGKFEGFVLNKRVYVEFWGEDEFDKVMFFFGVDECEGVDVKFLYYVV